MVSNRLRLIGGAAVVVAASLAILVASSQGADPASQQRSDRLRVLEAVVGDAPLDGACLGSGHIDFSMPDPKELSSLVEKSSDGQLSFGRWVAPDAEALASRAGGDLVVADGDEASVLITKDGDRRVETYTRFRSSRGDSVWYVTGVEMSTTCGPTSDVDP